MTIRQHTKCSFCVFIVLFILCIGVTLPAIAQETSGSDMLDAEEEFLEESSSSLDNEDGFLEITEGSLDPLDDEDVDIESEAALETESSSLFSRLRAGSRFTYRHELSYNFQEEHIVTNRSSLRLEWGQFFGEYYYLFLDGKATLFASNDHLAKAEDQSFLSEGNVREAYLQISGGDFSAKVGKQVIIWGEADGAIVTDVISPRDGSEFMFTTIEDARLGQFSLLTDYYSSIGTWSLIVNPDPQTDITPKADTEYVMMSFDPERFYIKGNEPDWNDTEYGFRWKQTLGKRDLAFMLANLVDNKAVFIDKGAILESRTQLQKEYRRFSMVGFAGNLVQGSFLWKAEAAYKFHRTFQGNNQDHQLGAVDRDSLDVVFGLEYSGNGAYTVSGETAWQHIIDWDEVIQAVREDEKSIALSWNKTFLHDTLDLQYTFSYKFKDKFSVHQLRSRYDVTDLFSGYLAATYFNISDKDNIFRDKSRITIRLEYQF